MARSTSCARDAMNSNASVLGTMSEAGSSRMRRISSPTTVPPGSRTATTSRSRDASHSARQANLRTLARAFRSLEDDEQAARHRSVSRG